ncbi:E3 ubiquitin-protein ligase RLIM [Symbiodinium microadriaticum]|uniref:RING-type E3 ubiquitin transferase n=1 Tax=Symbiodinium microadriaticum TaxID=2951 RepID=A0A1Q9CYV8_SYMMI|nr:E3 ubiquitin-protein ligase RLIM [Symbiodinium microadriaticum]
MADASSLGRHFRDQAGRQLIVESAQDVQVYSSECANAVDGLPPSEPVDLQAGDTCVICQYELRRGDATRPLPCGHSSWHDDCFLQWLTEQPSCPICRAMVGEDTGVSIFPEVVALSERVADLQSQVEALHLRCHLQALQAHLLQRAVLLESERQRLERQLLLSFEELASSGRQLAEIHAEFIRRWRYQRCRLRFVSAPLHTRHTRPGRIAELESSTQSFDLASSCDSSACSSGPDCRGVSLSAEIGEQARSILARLRNAVMRTPLPGAHVFRALAGRNGRMDPVQAARVLQHLETAASYETLARAFIMLDVDGSGFIEESDWMMALQLPRLLGSASIT